MAILEACVETANEARAVEQGGASRIELCANLAEQARRRTTRRSLHASPPSVSPLS